MKSAAEKSLQNKQLDWQEVLLCADRNLVVPALFFSLNRSDLFKYIPKDLAGYLHAVWTLNRRRNRMLRRAMIAVCARLNKLGIRPVLLKGAAALTEDEESGLFDRVMYDLDLFIPAGRSGEAQEFLKTQGYVPFYDNETFWTHHHHHEVALQHAEFPVSIELHKYILPLKKLSDIPGSIQEDSRKIRLDGAEMLLPGPTFRVFYNFVDHSLHDDFFFQNRIDIKRLYEFVQLRLIRDMEIKYREVQSYCRKKGIHTVWLTYCLSARRLFCCPTPYSVSRFSYAAYKEYQTRLSARFPFLCFIWYWLLRGRRLPVRLMTPSWYPMKLRSFLSSREDNA